MSGVGYYKADEVRRAANGRWVDVLARCGVNAQLLENRHGPCPGCGGNDRFRYDDKDGDGTWLCSQGGGGMISGDGIALLMHVTGKEWKECLAMAGDVVLGEAGQHRGRLGGTARNEGVAKAPERKREEWIPKFELKKLEQAVAGVPAAGKEFFLERSPVDPRGVGPGEFLEHAFAPGERVLVAANYKGQGDFLWEVGKGGYRLAAERGVKAVRSKLPTDGGKDGIWYLCNPVDGQWYANPRQAGKFSRRSAESVTAWRHLVLESDEAPADLWLRFLARVPMPVVAIYSSGGRSWHALVRVEMEDKASFDAYLRQEAKRVLPVLGADPGAMTPVRLTRLPGCTRGGRLQELIYLNPRPDVRKPVLIRDMPKLRGVEVAR